MTFCKSENCYDMVVVGGGITGAGIFLRAASMGISVLLLEQKDFAGGTSSRSSKMVHGGLRYLKQGKLFMTRNSVKERELLLERFPGLVEPLEFIMPVYRDHGPSKLTMGAGLSLYSIMAGKKQHRGLTVAETGALLPFIKKDNLAGGFLFADAQVDDARLVLRVMGEGCDHGGKALNYTRVRFVNRNSQNKVIGVTAEDLETGNFFEIKSPVVINATGAFAEVLHPSPEKGFHLRPLRGSHLIFPGSLLPVKSAVSFIHPRDLRPVFLFPWEGCAVLGTTDVDHGQGLYGEPFIQPEEAEYLMEGVDSAMPGLRLHRNQCIASMAGVRPVLSSGKTKASKESREHVVWEEKGLVTVTGGKLTTFNLLARDAIKAAKPYLPSSARKRFDFLAGLKKGSAENLSHKEKSSFLSKGESRRLYGRYGKRADIILGSGYDLSYLGSTSTLCGEIAFAAEHEQVRHLSDLMLRRTRLGILLPQGGREVLKIVESIARPILNWDEPRWNREKELYLNHWKSSYSSPF